MGHTAHEWYDHSCLKSGLRCSDHDLRNVRADQGADLEPDNYYQGMTNVSFEGCRFLDNRGSGVNMYLRQSTSKSPPVSATFRDCTIDGTGRGGFELGAMLPNVSGPGVRIENCHVRNTTGFGLSIFDKSASAAPIHVADSSFAGTFDPCLKRVVLPC